MASFSREFSVAFHVFPVQLARSIARSGALLGKADLGNLTRRTTGAVDRALGLTNVVHFYLARSATAVGELPILLAQMQPSKRSAIPHAVFELDTSTLDDRECRVCNWNLAVSRPGVPGTCRGGNWTRGTDAKRIASVWRAFQEMGPSTRRARGFWKQDALVPLLEANEIGENLGLLAKAPGQLPELLLAAPVSLDRLKRILVFSPADQELVSGILDPSKVECVALAGYSDQPDAVTKEIRQGIERILFDDASDPYGIDFDGVRPRLVVGG